MTESKKVAPDKETVLGISWLWAIPNHPFEPAARWHDEQYAIAAAHPGTVDARDVDLGLYIRMLEIAGENCKLKIEAYLFWCIARAWSSTVRRSLFK